MPNRIIKDSICESKGLSEVSFFAADLYKRLITYADDYGRFNADFQIILARLYPREIGLVSLDDIEDAMTELAGVEKIAFYTSKARHELYGCLPKWNEHQRVRDSKKKIPEPDNTSVNDYYLKRFVPLYMKVQIIERDQFKCQECGKLIYPFDNSIPIADSAKRFVKMGTGLFDIDHIVPVVQGGRATLENLRLLCPTCNRSRKKRFAFEEIVAFTQGCLTIGGNSPQVSAELRNVPPNPIQSNPIQSESNTNTEGKQKRKKFTPPTLEEVKAYADENGYAVDVEYFYKYYSTGHWHDSKGNPVNNWKQKLITWAKKDEVAPQKKKQYTTAAEYKPHKTIDVDAFNKLNAMFGGEQ